MAALVSSFSATSNFDSVSNKLDHESTEKLMSEFYFILFYSKFSPIGGAHDGSSLGSLVKRPIIN